MRRRGFAGRVPVRAAVVLERLEPARCAGDALAHVGEGQRRPVGEVARCGGPVRGEVAQGELDERLLALQPAR